MIEWDHPTISLRRQCVLLGLNRSSWYYQPCQDQEENLQLMRLLDNQYTRTPFYGSRRMTAWLWAQGHGVNRKRVQRLMRMMGIGTIYPRPRRGLSQPGHRVHVKGYFPLRVPGPLFS